MMAGVTLQSEIKAQSSEVKEWVVVKFTKVGEAVNQVMDSTTWLTASLHN